MPKRFLRHFRFRDGFQYLEITEIWYGELFSNRREKRGKRREIEREGAEEREKKRERKKKGRKKERKKGRTG